MKMRSLGWTLIQCDCSYIKRLGHRGRHAWREVKVKKCKEKMAMWLDWICLQAKEHLGLFVAARSWKRRGKVLSQSLQRGARLADTLTSDFWPQNYATINFCFNLWYFVCSNPRKLMWGVNWYSPQERQLSNIQIESRPPTSWAGKPEGSILHVGTATL